MVRPIIVKDGDRTFYGTRMAGYILHFHKKERLEKFANDLGSWLTDINEGKENRVSLSMNREFVKISELQEALMKPNNLQINTSRTMVVNLVARFLETYPHRDRYLKIFPHGIPNDAVKFDTSRLYELGEKYGTLDKGEDFDISLSNYRKIDNMEP